MSGQSDFLFAQPSFAEGAARILDFGDTLSQFNSSLTEEQADAIATRMDWGVVYQDLRGSLDRFGRALSQGKVDELAASNQ